MKKVLSSLILVIFFVFNAAAQKRDTVKTLKDVRLEMLEMPTNPAFAIMGTTPMEVQQPGSMPEFVVAVQNASNNFSQFPNNYGFAITPYWWVKGKDLSFEQDFASSNKLKFFRHLNLSAGVVNNPGDDLNLWRYGAGLQTTLLAGKVDSTKRANYQRHLLQYNRKSYTQREEYLNGSEAHNTLEKEIKATLIQLQDTTLKDKVRAELEKKYGGLEAQKSALMAELLREFDKTKDKKISKSDSLALYTSFNAMAGRYGWKWNVGVAAAYDLQSNKLDSSSLYRMGGWTNFGYSFKEGRRFQFSLSGAARFYYYDEVDYQLESSSIVINNLGVIDGGLLAVFSAKDLSISLEALYRYGMSSAYDYTYKVNAMLNYRFSENRMVYLALGNDFNDNSIAEPNQLRVFVGINLGFGDKANVAYELGR